MSVLSYILFAHCSKVIGYNNVITVLCVYTYECKYMTYIIFIY